MKKKKEISKMKREISQTARRRKTTNESYFSSLISAFAIAIIVTDYLWEMR
jgi:hypothetical protein